MHFHGVLRVSVPDKKIEHGSTWDTKPQFPPAPAAIDAHVGCAWVTDAAEAKEWALLHSGELLPTLVLRYMGTDILREGRPTTLRNISPIQMGIWG